LELLPYIQVSTRGEQAVLKGHLQLTARFADDGARGEKLEHFIPVEITLPLSRIPDLDRVGVTIDHFDADLLSSNTLHVTGVLSLHGIEIPQEAESWRDEPAEQATEKTMVFEPQATPPAPEPSPPPAPEPKPPFKPESSLPPKPEP